VKLFGYFQIKTESRHHIFSEFYCLRSQHRLILCCGVLCYLMSDLVLSSRLPVSCDILCSFSTLMLLIEGEEDISL